MTAAIETSVRLIPLDLLDENPLNPRRSMDEGALQELAASIKNSGITQPLVVRVQHLEGLIEERYQIVCGHRRAQAATIAGLEAVPCMVREMSDQEAAEIALVDNLQRVDVAALDEAEAFGKLLDLHGTIEAVAARVGKDVAHVAKRLKLRTLGTWQRDALNRKLITVDHALLLARLGVEEQDAALKWALNPQAGSKTAVDKVIAESVKYLHDDRRHRSWEPESVVRLREHIEQWVGRKLSRAPWDLSATNLEEEGIACVGCPSNTKANTALFSDLDIDEATCADGACFERKRETFVHIKLAAAGAPPKTALQLSWKETSTEPRMEIGEPCDGPKGLNNFTRVPKLTQIFKAGQWVEAKKGSCANILAGVTVDWSDAANRGYMGSNQKLRKPGELLSVCVNPECKVHRKSYQQGASANGGRVVGESWEKQQEREIAANKAFNATEKPVRRALYDAAREGLDSKRLLAAVIKAMNSERQICLGLEVDPKDPVKHIAGLIGVASEAGLRNLLFHAQFGDELEPGGYERTREDRGRVRLRDLAKLAGVDAAAIERKFDQAEKPAKTEPVKAATPKKAAPKKAAPAKKAAKPQKKAGAR